MKVDGGYNWFKKTGTNCHGNTTLSYEMSKVYDIISKNHFNSNPEQWHCDECKTYDWLNGSYIAFVEEDEFLANPQKYIDNAYNKSQNDAKGYDLVKKDDVMKSKINFNLRIIIIFGNIIIRELLGLVEPRFDKSFFV